MNAIYHVARKTNPVKNSKLQLEVAYDLVNTYAKSKNQTGMHGN